MSYFLPASMKESRPPLPKSSLTWMKPKRFNFGNFSWMKSTRSATNLRSGIVQRNTHSLPCVVMRCAVPLTTICGTSSSRNTCAAARLTGLDTEPSAMHTLSRVAKRRAITAPSSGLPASSPMMSSIWRPSTPPAAFFAFAAISAPWRRLCPCAAALPLIGPNAPIFIGPPCARPMSGTSAPTVAAAPTCMNLLRSNDIASSSHLSKIARTHVRVRQELGPRALHADAASLHDVSAVGKLQRKIRVLLYKEYRHPGFAKRAHRAHHLRYHEWREAERRLIEQEELRPGHHRAAEGEHLLLAAGERARRLAAPARERGKAPDRFLKATLHFGALAHEIRGGEQVLLHAQLGEHPPPLRYVHQAERGNAVRREPRDRPAVELDRAFARPQEAADRAQRRALAGAVRPDHCHDLAALYLERHSAQRERVVVPRVDRLKRQHA